jgi:hypothetical protein
MPEPGCSGKSPRVYMARTLELLPAGELGCGSATHGVAVNDGGDPRLWQTSGVRRSQQK